LKEKKCSNHDGSNFSVVTSDREHSKHSKYDDLCKQYNWKMVPFVMESYGSLGSEAMQYIDTIVQDCDHPQAAKNYLLNCLSVALQTGNGNVAQIGILRKQQDRMMRDRSYVEENHNRNRNQAHVHTNNHDCTPRFYNQAALCDTSDSDSEEDRYDSNKDVHRQESSDGENSDSDNDGHDAHTVKATLSTDPITFADYAVQVFIPTDISTVASACRSRSVVSTLAAVVDTTTCERSLYPAFTVYEGNSV